LLLGLCTWQAQAAPHGRYQVRAESVTDTVTGLTWQKDVGPAPLTWPDASAYCASLAIDAGGWRMPALKELLTLVDPHQLHPAIDPDAFPNTPHADFWATSAAVFAANNNWIVNFDTGESTALPRSSLSRVRCVR
jgi:hypothetical protein